MTSYSSVKDECDIVMKGGITSGMVYPLTVLELARRYRLRRNGIRASGEFDREVKNRLDITGKPKNRPDQAVSWPGNEPTQNIEIDA
jgi:hypothetical protein